MGGTQSASLVLAGSSIVSCNGSLFMTFSRPPWTSVSYPDYPADNMFLTLAALNLKPRANDIAGLRRACAKN